MHIVARLMTALVLLIAMGAALATAAPQPHPIPPAADLQALAGEWLYVEDLTEGRARERQGPPMSVYFRLQVEDEAVLFLRGKGANPRTERIPLDGSTIKIPEAGKTSHNRGEWKNGVLHYEVKVVNDADGAVGTVIRREFRPSTDGLLVRVTVGDPARLDSLALYRHPQDIPLPEPAAATIEDLSWLAGDWVGMRGSRSIEERWSPAAGGALLGVSRTISREQMVAFEFLRIVERDGSLVYLAQPGGRPPTEFVLTERGERRAVFANPRHDSPQRIVYELSAEGTLTATISFFRGGSGTSFTFTREAD